MLKQYIMNLNEMDLQKFVLQALIFGYIQLA
jgi:hypothetical protein